MRASPLIRRPSAFASKHPKRWLWALFGVHIALAGSACSPHRDLSLLNVESLGPALLETGDRIRVNGHGFPVGERATLTLDGVLHRPGGKTVDLHGTFDGRVHENTQVEFVVSGDWIRERGRGTFEGDARLRVLPRGGPFGVYGRTHARFNIVPRQPLDASSTVVATTASAVTEALGAYGLLLEETPGTGLEVTDVVPASPAEQSGLLPGDNILSLDGVQLLELEDFQPRQAASTLIIQRPRVAGLHTLSLKEPASPARNVPTPWWLFVVVGLAIGLISPLHVALNDASTAVASSIGLRSHALSAALGLFASVAIVWGWTPGSASTWIVALASMLALFCATRFTRHPLRDYATLVVSVAIVLLLASSHTLARLVLSQGSSPLDWWVLKHPAALLAFGAFAHALREIARAERGVLARAYVGVASVLGAVVFLGGWSGFAAGPLEALPVGRRALVAVVLAVKASVVYAVPFMVASVPRAVFRTTLFALVLAVATTAVRLDAAPNWSMALAGICCGVFVRWAATAVGRQPTPTLLSV